MPYPRLYPIPPLLAVLAAFIPATNGFAPLVTTFPNFFELLILESIAGLTLIFNGLVF